MDERERLERLKQATEDFLDRLIRAAAKKALREAEGARRDADAIPGRDDRSDRGDTGSE